MTRKPFTTHQWLDIAVLVVLIIFTAWYLYDSYTASTHIMNLILVLPLAGLIIALCTFELIRQVVKPTAPPEDQETISSVAPVILLFGAYVLSLNWLGFDVGTFLFVASFLWINGEKRIHWILAYSVVFAAVTALFFSKMLPYPMPMLLFPTLY